MRHRTETLVVGATAELPEEADIPQSPSASKAWSHGGQIDFTRLDVSLRVLFATTFALFIALQLPWYTFHIDRPHGPATGSASAMAAGGWRYLIWTLVLLTLVFLFLESVTSWKRPGWLKRYEILLGVAVVDLVLVLVAGLAVKGVPPHPRGLPVPDGALQTSFGAWIALILAITALAAAIAGRDESGAIRVAELRVHVAGLRLQSPLTGVRSPFVRTPREGVGATAGAAAVVETPAGAPPSDGSVTAWAPAEQVVEPAASEAVEAAVPAGTADGSVAGEPVFEGAPADAAGQTVEKQTASEKVKALLGQAGPRFGTAWQGFRRVFGLDHERDDEAPLPAEEEAPVGAVGEHPGYDPGTEYAPEQAWDPNAYAATEEWSGEYAPEWQAEEYPPADGDYTQAWQAPEEAGAYETVAEHSEYSPVEGVEYYGEPYQQQPDEAYEYQAEPDQPVQPEQADYYQAGEQAAHDGEEQPAEPGHYPDIAAADAGAEHVPAAEADETPAGEVAAGEGSERPWEPPSPPPAPSL